MKHRRILSVWLRRFLGAACSSLVLCSSASAQALHLIFFDVGQGDAALIVTPEGRTALIDAGRSGGPVLRYLATSRLDTLDLVVASHNHADHIGGMTAVLGATVVRYYLDNGVPHTTATYQRTIQAVAASGAQYLEATARTITLGSARLRVLPPPGVGGQNENSVGILVEFGRFRALLTGDSELRELHRWLESDSVPPVAVVKVAHHGSWNGTSREWAERTQPQAAVISVGRNSYGHPNPSTIAAWQGIGAAVYRTDLHGSIQFLAQLDGSFTVGRLESIVLDTALVFRAAPIDTGTASPIDTIVGSARACCRVCVKGKACGNS